MSKWLVDIHGDIEGDYELICKAESSIPLDRIKKAREEMLILGTFGAPLSAHHFVEFMDKLIAESEGEDE